MGSTPQSGEPSEPSLKSGLSTLQVRVKDGYEKFESYWSAILLSFQMQLFICPVYISTFTSWRLLATTGVPCKGTNTFKGPGYVNSSKVSCGLSWLTFQWSNIFLGKQSENDPTESPIYCRSSHSVHPICNPQREEERKKEQVCITAASFSDQTHQRAAWPDLVSR